MIDHQREDSVVSSAVAAVGAVAASATTPQGSGQGMPMHRVLSAPLLSPSGGSSDGTRPRRERLSGSGGLDSHSNRLPPIRQVNVVRILHNIF